MTTRLARKPAEARSALGLVGLTIALAIAPGPVRAQEETGKLEGFVRSSDGAGLPAATIVILGSAFGAQADPQGHYFINNIPSGSIAVRAAFIGYRPVEIRDVRISAGHTVTLDITLETAPVELREIAVLAADNPLVPRDEVTTKQRIDGAFLRGLPVDDLMGLLELQPGVAAYTGSVRGGRANETVTYVDGVPISPVQRGLGPQFHIPVNAVQEASLTSGATSAEFGNAMSGIVSIQTRSGGSSYSGSLSYETDEPFGAAHGHGLNRIEMSVGGPLARNLTFFVSAELEGHESPPFSGGRDLDRVPIFVSAGVDTTVRVPIDPANPDSGSTPVDVHRFAIARGRCDEFTGSSNRDIRGNYGRPCTGIRIPFNPGTNLSDQAKLSYTYGSGSRITLSYLGGRGWNRDTPYENFYALDQSYGFEDRKSVATLEWTQNLARTPERALALQTYLSYQEDRTARSALTPGSQRATQDPFGGFILGSVDLLFDFDNFPLTDGLIRDIREGGPDSVVTPRDPVVEPTIDLYRNNAYGLTGWADAGGPSGELGLFLENRYVGRSVLDWQLDRFNRLRAGAELVRYTIGRYDTCCLFAAFLDRPITWDVFLEDRLDLGDVVLVGGLRLDGYSTKAQREYVLDTVSTNPRFGEYVQFYGALPAGVGEGASQGQPLLALRKDAWHHYLSPHVQVAFPVTDRTNVRLSYAHQVQAPDFRFVLDGPGTDMDFGRTIAYEFGVRHALSPDVVVDVVLYNKDNLASPAVRTLTLNHPLTGLKTPSQYLTNADYGNTRGIELRLDGRIGAFVNGTLSYTYQDAKSTASDPRENEFRAARSVDAIAGLIHPPPQAILPTRFSRPHSLAGAVSFAVPAGWRHGTVAGAILGNLAVFSTLLYTSGTPYTPCPDAAGNAGALAFFGCPQIGPRQERGALNSVRLPAQRQFDLRITKGFDLGRFRVTPYLDARNLLNFTNTLNVFAVTGTTTDERDRQNHWTADSAGYADEARESGFLMEGGEMDLRFGGVVASGCDVWVRADRQPAAPNCVYLIRAEERYGDGDHVFTLAEQRRASDARYQVDHGLHAFTGEPRRVRVGVEVTF